MPTGRGIAVFLIMQSYKKKLTYGSVRPGVSSVLDFFKKNIAFVDRNPKDSQPYLYRLHIGLVSKLYIDYLGSMSTFH